MKKQTGKVITKKTTFGEILKKNKDSAEILMNSGLHCFGCPMSAMESLEEGCLAHGMSKKEIEELIEKLNGKKRKNAR